MKNKTKAAVTFKSEAEERAFWEANDSTSHVDWSKVERVRIRLTWQCGVSCST
jgi:CopG antitoxin of type II toxin-antitoxin system